MNITFIIVLEPRYRDWISMIMIRMWAGIFTLHIVGYILYYLSEENLFFLSEGGYQVHVIII